MTSPETLILSFLILIGFFLGGLYACQSIKRALLFTLFMPMLYAAIWLICAIAFSSIFTLPPFDQNTNREGQVSVLASIASVSLFVLQISSMTHDPHGGPQGFSTRKKRSGRYTAPSVGLQNLPTRKRWGG